MMQQLTVYFDEHHTGSARELARIIADNWPAMVITLRADEGTGSELSRFEYKSPDPNATIVHSCQHCNAALIDGL